MSPEPNAMMSALVVTMAQRTGRSLEEWIALICRDGPDPLDQKAVRAWLKAEHGLAQNTQFTVAHMAALDAGWVPPSTEDYVDELYSGKKQQLRPLHDQVTALILGLAPGDDENRISVEGRASYIPFIHRTQFAAVAPGPYGRLRVGVRLRSRVAEVHGLDVEPAKNFAQATHWVHLSADATAEEVAALEPLLRAAYDQNG